MPKRRTRVLIEECRYLDVRRLNRDGVLADGVPQHCRAASLTINGTQTVKLAWTNCHYGNKRPWFHCPCCNRRCAKLLDYRNHGFRCRQCYGAGYAIENETPEWRLRRRVRKIEDRLGKDFDRPKGMHHTTYQRLCDEAADLELWADALLVDRLCRHFPDLLVS